jgi:hypothetical protein
MKLNTKNKSNQEISGDLDKLKDKSESLEFK